MFHVILHRPEIPPNTGNVIRLCANTGVHLPYGLFFRLKILFFGAINDYGRRVDTLKVATLPPAPTSPHAAVTRPTVAQPPPRHLRLGPRRGLTGRVLPASSAWSTLSCVPPVALPDNVPSRSPGASAAGRRGAARPRCRVQRRRGSEERPGDGQRASDGRGTQAGACGLLLIGMGTDETRQHTSDRPDACRSRRRVAREPAGTIRRQAG